MKRLLVSLLTAAMLLSLVACGNKPEQGGTPSPSPTEAETPKDNESKDNDTNEDTQQPGNNGANTPTNGASSESDAIDEADILDVQNAVVALSGQKFGNFLMSEEITEQSMTNLIIGSEDFQREFTAAARFAPMMGSMAFEMAVFRVSEDANGFADELRSKANPVKWICVQAEAVKTAVRGNTILFVMSDEHTADALIEAFEQYNPATYVPPVAPNALTDRSMEDVLWDIASGCGFIEMATDGSYDEAAKEKLGLSEISQEGVFYDDSFVDYSTETNAYPYAIALLRFSEGVDMSWFMNGIVRNADTSAYGKNASYTIFYDRDERVVIYCVASEPDIIAAFQESLLYSYPDMIQYE